MDATFGLNNIKAVVNVNYDLNGASFVFPPQEGSNADGIIPSAKRGSYIYLLFLTIATLHNSLAYQSNLITHIQR